MLIVRILMQLISESETEHLEFEFALEFFCALENLESFFRK